MRLSQAEISGIVDTLTGFIFDQKAELRLYGSRVKDHLKGGDIDLLLIVADEKAKTSLLLQKPEILVAIKTNLGERRIDLKIVDMLEFLSDPFCQIIDTQSVLLHSF